MLKKKRNIILLFIYSFLSTFLLFRSCDTLYYLSRGVSSSKYIIFTVISAIVTILFQIPIGMFGDKINKKKILLLSNLLLLIGVIFYIISHSFVGLSIGIIFHTLQTLFSNGIVNSILYDEVNNKEEFSKLLFIKSIFSYTGYGVAMILGGVVADINLSYMYYISLIPIVINFLVLFLLKDIEVSGKTISLSKIFREARYVISKKRIVQYLLLYEGFLMSIITVMAESHPEYSQRLGISATVIGIYTALMLVVGIVGEYIASRIKSDFIKVFIFPIIVSLTLLMIGILNNYYGIIFIVLIQLFYDIQYNGMLSILHEEVSSEYRVTMEGVLSLITSIFAIVIGIVTSIILKFMSIANMYIVIGVLLFFYILLLYLFYRRNID